MHKAASILFNFYNENFKIREDFVLRKAIKSSIDKMSKEQIKALDEFMGNMEVESE
jgi:hypothetical protein